MKKLIYPIVLSLLFPLLSQAQSNYKPGYIVNLKNDTVKGFIDYKEWELNPNTFNFKSSINDKKTEKFSTANVNAFAITNLEYYKKAIVHASNASVSVESLSTGIDTSYAVDTVFLKEIINGKKVSLYTFKDRIKTRFYIEDKKEDKLTELNYYIYLNPDNVSEIRTIHTYRTQLSALASKYKIDNKASRQISNAEYNETDFKEIIKSINGESSQQVIHESSFGARFFVGTGIKFNQLNFGSDAPVVRETNSNSIFPTLSAGVDLFANKHTRKLILRAEIAITNNHYSFHYPDPNISGKIDTFDFKQFSATIIPQIIYNFYSKGNLKIFIDAGIAMNFSSYNNYSYEIYFNTSAPIIMKNYPKFSTQWPTAPIKLGLTISNKLELYGSYYVSSSISKNEDVTANISAYQFGINYLFDR